MIITKKGFSLIEVLVTVTILTIIGIAISVILARSFSGNTKTQLIGNIKQNGQAALGIIEKDIRDSETIACPLVSGASAVLALLTRTDGKYIRFIISPETITLNGVIYREEVFYSTPPDTATLCSTTPGSSKVALTDNSSTSAVSIKSGSMFTITKNPGYKDTVTISFNIGPGLGNGAGFVNNVGGTNNSYNFQTTVQLR